MSTKYPKIRYRMAKSRGTHGSHREGDVLKFKTLMQCSATQSILSRKADRLMHIRPAFRALVFLFLLLLLSVGLA